MTALEVARPARDREAVRAWIDIFPDAADLARAIANTDFVPGPMKGKPAEIAAAILYGDEVGLGPMQSLAKISIIDGRPALAAETQRALIYAAGHALWTVEATITSVTVAGRRRGADEVVQVTWTLDDARRASLAGRPAWRTYPRQMLLARASAELARTLFPDAIGGLAAIEEFTEPDAAALAAMPATTDDEAPAPATRTRRRGRSTTPIAAVTAQAPTPPPTDLPPLPGEEGTATMSEAQRRALMRLFKQRNITTRAGRHDYAATIVGHGVTDSASLTADEASRIISVLHAEVGATETVTGSAAARPQPDAPPQPRPGGADDVPPVHPDQLTIDDVGLDG